MAVLICPCALRLCHDSSRSAYVPNHRLFSSSLSSSPLGGCSFFSPADLDASLPSSPIDAPPSLPCHDPGLSMPVHGAAARRRPRSPSASPPSARRRRHRSADAPVLPTPSPSPARRPRPPATSPPPPQRRRGLADVSSVSIPALPRRPRARGRVLFSGDASDSEFSVPSQFPGLLEGLPHDVPADFRLSHAPSVLAVVPQPSLRVEEVPSVAVQSHLPTCLLVLPRSRRRRGLDEIPGNSAPLPFRTLPSMPVPSGLTAHTNCALLAVSNQSVSMLTTSDLEARRREVRLGKRPADDVSSVPTESVSYAVSSDDELSSYRSALAAGFFTDGESSNATTHVDVPSNLSDLNAWAPFPSAHSSALGSLAHPGPSLSQIVSSDDDSPDMGTVGLHYLARVHPTPCIPATRHSLNRRMRVAVRRHRAFLRAGYQVGSVQLPLSADFISMLKRAWPDRSYYNGPHHLCVHCGASFWFRERCKRSSKERHRPVYNGCCRGGRVSLPVYPDWPPPLDQLLRFDGGRESNRFMRLIREYNSMFAFTSLGVHIDNSINIGGGPYVFKICGVVCHQIGSLLPPTDNPVPKFAQLYIYDTLNELDNRMGILSADDNDVYDSVPLSERLLSFSHGRRRRRDMQHSRELDALSGRPTRHRRARREVPDRAIVDSLRTMLNAHNPLVYIYVCVSLLPPHSS